MPRDAGWRGPVPSTVFGTREDSDFSDVSSPPGHTEISFWKDVAG